VRWEVRPGLGDERVEAALLAAVAKELAEEDAESAWWRSGFGELGGDATPEQPWRDAGVVEP
jgi:hypothetical protein